MEKGRGPTAGPGGGEGREGSELEKAGEQGPLVLQEGRKARQDGVLIRSSTDPIKKEQGEAVGELRRKGVRGNA